MRLTPEISQAIKDAKEAHGSYLALGKATGIHYSSFGKYVDGRTQKIEDDTWVKLEPLLRPYLKSAVAESDARYESTFLPQTQPILPIPASELPSVKRYQRLAPKRPLEEAIIQAIASMPESSLLKVCQAAIEEKERLARLQEGSSPPPLEKAGGAGG